MSRGIVYLTNKKTKDTKVFFVPNDNDYEAYESLLQFEEISEVLNYDEDTLEASTESYELNYLYVDEICYIATEQE